MRSAAADGDLHRFVGSDVGFHRVIVEASGNQTLIDMWETLHIDLRTRLTLIQRHDDLLEVAERHRPVMEALDAGDGMLAGRLVREHIEGFGRSVAEGLAQRPSSEES
jgi:DNA-binding GntR family transcriptional regulator